jgi:hypothetical protein
MNSALATEWQQIVEERAIKLFKTDIVREAHGRTLAYFLADKNAALPDQRTLIEQSVSAHHFHAAMMAASENRCPPGLIWSLAHDHTWMGHHVPDTRFGQDNPDNCYRLAAIDSSLTYRISGQFVDRAPCDFSFSALKGQPGENNLAHATAVISLNDIDVDAAGRFQIVADASATGARRNHICIAGASMFFVRDTLGDWGCERPSVLSIECEGEVSEPAYDEVAAAARAAQLGESISRYMLDELQHGVFERGVVNELNPPWAAGQNGGLATQASSLGYYHLQEDDAMIITAAPMGARYVGMQITDVWMLSFEYRDRLSCLNHTQALLDDDGKFRWVISARDPEIYNWLDSGGYRHGTILLRWQHLPGGTTPAADAVQSRIVKVSEVFKHLPIGTKRVDAAARKKQRAQRRAEYAHRMTVTSEAFTR